MHLIRLPYCPRCLKTKQAPIAINRQVYPAQPHITWVRGLAMLNCASCGGQLHVQEPIFCGVPEGIMQEIIERLMKPADSSLLPRKPFGVTGWEQRLMYGEVGPLETRVSLQVQQFPAFRLDLFWAEGDKRDRHPETVEIETETLPVLVFQVVEILEHFGFHATQRGQEKKKLNWLYLENLGSSKSEKDQESGRTTFRANVTWPVAG